MILLQQSSERDVRSCDVKQVRIYGDSLLKFVLFENGRYVVNREPIQRFSAEFRFDIVNRSYYGSCVDKGLQRLRLDLERADNPFE